MSTKSKSMCVGCRNDFYNHGTNSTTGECWMFAKAKVVQATQVGSFQEPPYKWNPQTTLTCHAPDGRHWLEHDDCRFEHNWSDRHE
jgi:hypothetical protein